MLRFAILHHLDVGLKNHRSADELILMSEHTKGDDDRPRNPRFSCGGVAKISFLPSNGLFLSGKIRDLSLGECWVDTPVPIACGARAEIVVHVNSSSFRAVGEVRGIHGNLGSRHTVHLSKHGRKRPARGSDRGVGEVAGAHKPAQSCTPGRGIGIVPQATGERKTSGGNVERAASFLRRDLRPRRVRKRIKYLPLAGSQTREGSRL